MVMLHLVINSCIRPHTLLHEKHKQIAGQRQMGIRMRIWQQYNYFWQEEAVQIGKSTATRSNEHPVLERALYKLANGLATNAPKNVAAAKRRAEIQRNWNRCCADCG